MPYASRKKSELAITVTVEIVETSDPIQIAGFYSAIRDLFRLAYKFDQEQQTAVSQMESIGMILPSDE